MAQIEKPNIKAYVVELTEYDRGYGQKPYDTLYFDNSDEAIQYATDYNKKHNNLRETPDWFVHAEYIGPLRV